MILTFTPIKVWPEGWQGRKGRKTGQFTAAYSDTLEVLDREAWFLKTTSAQLQVDATFDQVRRDGQLRADARVGHPGVILTLVTAKHGTLTYATDRFDAGGTYKNGRWSSIPGWQQNLRAVALGLEALRKVERYGIAERGEQYAGWKELGSGIPMPTAMTVEEAAEFIAAAAGQPGGGYVVIESPAARVPYYRRAAKRLHPDTGGDPEQFKRLQEAKAVLAL